LEPALGITAERRLEDGAVGALDLGEGLGVDVDGIAEADADVRQVHAGQVEDAGAGADALLGRSAGAAHQRLDAGLLARAPLLAHQAVKSAAKNGNDAKGSLPQAMAELDRREL